MQRVHDYVEQKSGKVGDETWITIVDRLLSKDPAAPELFHDSLNAIVGSRTGQASESSPDKPQKLEGEKKGEYTRRCQALKKAKAGGNVAPVPNKSDVHMMRMPSYETEDDQDAEPKPSYPLVSGGEQVAVSEENGVRFVNLWLRAKLEDEIDEQARWFADGLTRVVPAGVVSMFNARELQQMLGGSSMDDRALEDLMAHTRGTRGMSADCPTWSYFWGAMRQMTVEERMQVFTFATGMPRCPLAGMASLSPHEFTLSATGSDLPIAHTCFNRLDLPRSINSAAEMRECLVYAAVNSGRGFFRA